MSQRKLQWNHTRAILRSQLRILVMRSLLTLWDGIEWDPLACLLNSSSQVRILGILGYLGCGACWLFGMGWDPLACMVNRSSQVRILGILGMRSLLTLCPAMKIRRRARLAEARKMCTLHLTMCAEHSTMCTVHCRKQSTSCASKQCCTAWKVNVVQVYFEHSHLSVINRLLLQVQKLASPSSYID